MTDRDIKPADVHVVDQPEARPSPIDVARARAHLRLVPKPLAYCRPENENGRRR